MSGAFAVDQEDTAPGVAQTMQASVDDALLREADDDLASTEPPPQEGLQQEAKASPRFVAPKAVPKSNPVRDAIKGAPDALRNAIGDSLSLKGMSRAAGDVAVGIAESPGAIVRGVQGAGHELLDSIDSAAAWVAANAARGLGDPEAASDIEARRAGGESVLGHIIPEPGKAHSVTGNIIQGISQFVTGYVAGGKVLKEAGLVGRGAKTADVFVKSAFSDAFAFDPAQERLSNLVQENPSLQNPVTEFLASQPGDTEAEGRFKNALEGLGIGGAVQGVFTLAMKGLRAYRALKPAAPPSEEVITRHVKEGLAPLGDTSPDAPLVATKPQADPNAMLTKAAEKTRDAQPGDIKGVPGIRVFHGTPHEFDKFDVSKIGTGEGNNAFGRGLYFAESDEVARGYQQRLSTKQVASLDGKPLPVPDAAIPHDKLTPQQLSAELLQHSDGQVQNAIDDAVSLAAKPPKGKGYASPEQYRAAAKWLEDNKGRITLQKNTGQVYEAQFSAKADELLDWDAPLAQQSPKVREALEKVAGRKVTEADGATGGELYDNIARERGKGKYATSATPDGTETVQALRENGVKGIRYLDGNSRGAGQGSRNYVVFSDKDVRMTGRLNHETNQFEPYGAAPTALEPNAGGNQVYINFARINAPEDVKTVIQKAANLYKGDIAQAQRGVQSFEATKALADDMGMTVDDLLSRRKGPNGARVPFTAEEALAARRLYTASGEKLAELAERAAGPNAGPIDLFNFRKMMATHYAIQQEVIGARTETARALSSWRIGAEGGQAQMRMIEQAMETAGPDSVKMAQEFVRLRANGATPAAVAQFVRKSTFGNVMQGVREVYVNGLLSNPLTHIVNFASNAGTFLLSTFERGVARQISKLTGSNAVAAGEASTMLYGAVMSQMDAWRLAWKTIRTGETTDLLGKVDQPRQAAIHSTSDDAFGTSVRAIGSAVRIPSLLMGSSDQYWKAVNYRANLQSSALRQAASEGLSGSDLERRVAEIVANPPENLKIEAADAAFYNTFNSSMGWFGKTLMKMRESGGALNPLWLVATFIRTPVNIAKYAFERTPLAPLVGQWRAEIAAGGARRDIALARAATGTMVMGVTQTMVDGGIVTGAAPEDQNEAALWRREGRQPYSVKIGDTWYSYNRADPFGMIMGFAADVQGALGRGEVAPDDVDEWQEVMGAGIAAISNTAMEKTFMRSYAGFVEMVTDPKRYAPSQIKSTLQGFVPYSGILGAAARVMDPEQKDAKTPLDAIMARIPGLSERIIPRRDLWGETLVDPHHFYNALSPMRASTEAAEPIDKELDRLHTYPEGIGWKTSIDGVQVNFSEFPEALDEYRRLAGNGFKHPAWGVGLKDFLNQVVTGGHPLSPVYKLYSDGEEGGRAAFIRKAISDYRSLAGRELLNNPKYEKFKQYYQEEAAAQRAASQKVNLQ